MSDFRHGFVEADGFRIRYAEAGSGPALVHLHGAGGMRLTQAHPLFAQEFRVIALEMPGFGQTAENTKTQTMADLATTVAAACEKLGLDRYNLWGTSFGGKTALCLALQYPERVLALVLEAPAVIRQKGARPSSGTPAERARQLYAHPERMPPLPELDPAIAATQQALVRRLIGPNRDLELEAQLAKFALPTLVVFGTDDRIIVPEMGHFYKELIPNCHLVFVYDAGHAISAERPEAFVEVATDFLERHEAFVISRTETAIHP